MDMLTQTQLNTVKMVEIEPESAVLCHLSGELCRDPVSNHERRRKTRFVGQTPRRKTRLLATNNNNYYYYNNNPIGYNRSKQPHGTD